MTSTSTWKEADVATFRWLHLDKADLVEDECFSRLNGRTNRDEWIYVYKIEAKACPCLILDRENGYFRVARLTAHPRQGKRHLLVEGVDNLTGESYFPLERARINWVHEKFADRRLGTQNRLAYKNLMAKVSLSYYKATPGAITHF
jgi:hypothetical protein